MLKDALHRKFDVVMAWAIDRLGRSLIDLLDTIKHLETVGVDLYLDTTMPQGKLLFQMTGAFAEFERSMIQQRVRAGLRVVKDKLARDGKFDTRRGVVRTKLGRPGAEPEKLEAAWRALADGDRASSRPRKPSDSASARYTGSSGRSCGAPVEPQFEGIRSRRPLVREAAARNP